MRNKSGWVLAAIFFSVACFSVACAKHMPFDNAQAKVLIEGSEAWQGPIAPQLYVDPSFKPSPSTKREMLKLELVGMKDDGPMGMAGQTADAVFTWRWTEGYDTGKVFHTKARFNNGGTGWHVYDDKLRESLWASERGDID